MLPTMGMSRLGRGGRLTHRLAGGGGWGDPLTRDPALVRDDVSNDKVSLEGARRDYGVVIDPATLAIDRPATERLRRERSTAAEG